MIFDKKRNITLFEPSSASHEPDMRNYTAEETQQRLAKQDNWQKSDLPVGLSFLESIKKDLEAKLKANKSKYESEAFKERKHEQLDRLEELQLRRNSDDN